MVKPLSLRDALGGRWAWNINGWAMMLVPGVLVVAVQETTLLRVPFGQLVLLILVSSAIQSLAAGVVTAVIATIARRRWPVIPLGVVISMWLVIGIVRGLAGGAVAELVARDTPLFAQRIVAWVIVSLIWIPLFVYCLAQIELRRSLLAELAELKLERDLEESHARLSAAELRSSIAAIIRDRIRPIMDEIQRSLKTVAGSSDVTALRVISAQLSEVWLNAVTLVEGARTPAREEHDVLTSRPARASVAAALAIEVRRPGRAALLSGIAIAPAVIPVALMADDLDGTADTLIALAVVVAFLFLSAVLRRLITPAPKFLELAAAILGYLAAGLCGSVTIAALEMDGFGRLELVTLWLLPLATVVSASCVAVAVAIRIANGDLVDSVVIEHERLVEAHRRSAALDATVREQLALLMHGPVQGRLAACVMALNFHLNSNEDPDPHRSEIVTSAVINHLAAASRDLDQLPILTLTGRLLA